MVEGDIEKIGALHKIYLAPMAGITDRTFREVCSRFFSVDGFTSEMVSVHGLIYGNEKTKLLTCHSLHEKPFAVQLFGREPDLFVKATEILMESPQRPDIVDINMGCPMPKIVNNGAGSALMREPALCGKIIKSLTSNFGIPITVKIRAGWDSSTENAPLVAKICEENGASAVTVHGRTRTQMYSGKCSLDVIKRVKDAVNIPVIGNGDITDFETCSKMLDYTGCDSVAIGRAAIGNPWIFDDILGKPRKSIEERISVVLWHFNKLCECFGDILAVKIFKKHLLKYCKTIFKTSRFNEKICGSSTKKDVLRIIDLTMENDDVKNF